MAEEVTQTTAPVVEAPATTPTTPEAKPEAAPKAAPKSKERSLLTLNKDTPATEGDTPADPATTDKPAFVMPEKMQGKTAEEIAEMYVNLEKTKAGKPAEIPEAYNFDSLKEAGLTIYDEQHGTETTEMLKELGLSQDQVNKAIPHWKKQAERLGKEAFEAGKKAVYAEEFGDAPNWDAQVAAINQEWGTEARAKVAAITKFAETLPAEVRDWPLNASAAGLKILERLMAEADGPQIITDTSSNDPVSLEAKLNQIITSDRYKKPGPQRAAAIAEVDRIAAQIAKLQQ